MQLSMGFCTVHCWKTQEPINSSECCLNSDPHLKYNVMGNPKADRKLHAWQGPWLKGFVEKLWEKEKMKQILFEMPLESLIFCVLIKNSFKEKKTTNILPKVLFIHKTSQNIESKPIAHKILLYSMTRWGFSQYSGLFSIQELMQVAILSMTGPKKSHMSNSMNSLFTGSLGSVTALLTSAQCCCWASPDRPAGLIKDGLHLQGWLVL